MSLPGVEPHAHAARAYVGNEFPRGTRRVVNFTFGEREEFGAEFGLLTCVWRVALWKVWCRVSCRRVKVEARERVRVSER